MRPELPVGYHRFARSGFVNCQLNRWHSLGYTRKEEIERAADPQPVRQAFKRTLDRARLPRSTLLYGLGHSDAMSTDDGGRRRVQARRR